MKKLILLLIVTFIISCTDSNVKKKNAGIILENGDNPLTEFTYDGCEYFYKSTGHRFGICHKGNCKNPIHCYNNN